MADVVQSAALRIVPWRLRAAWLLQVLDCPDLPPAAPTVAIALADRVNERTLTAWPKQSSLAERCRVTTRTVRTCLAALETAGHLSTKYRGPKAPLITIIVHEERNVASTQKRNEASTFENERVESYDTKSGKLASEMCPQVSVCETTSPSERKKEHRRREPTEIGVLATALCLPTNDVMAKRPRPIKQRGAR